MLTACEGHDPSKSPSDIWWEMDPCTSYPLDESWYAPDIVKMINSAGHEIACHTFSHLDFTRPECTLDIAKFEIEEWLRASSSHDISSRSFVFPRNNPGYLELLPEYGFTHYAIEGEPQDFRNPSLPLPSPSPVGEMVIVPRTLQISRFNFKNPRNTVKLSRLLTYWKKHGGFLHIWTHEWSLTNNRDLMILGSMLKFAGKYGEGVSFTDL